MRIKDDKTDTIVTDSMDAQYQKAMELIKEKGLRPNQQPNPEGLIQCRSCYVDPVFTTGPFIQMAVHCPKCGLTWSGWGDSIEWAIQRWKEEALDLYNHLFAANEWNDDYINLNGELVVCSKKEKGDA